MIYVIRDDHIYSAYVWMWQLLYSINSYKEYFFLVENSDINGFINIINLRKRTLYKYLCKLYFINIAISYSDREDY